MKISSAELRQKYLNFFKDKGHKIIPSASLIPENDPTVLFTTAGMHPLVPYLLGQKHPEGKRLASCQKCIRTGDIDDVGDDTHLTFFEMLGNWSLGDYWKEEAIKMSFEFLTKELKIPLERLAVSCFMGDKHAPKDEESAKIWESLGVKKERIAFLGKEDNWWGPAGKIGPCGPDTEMFYWVPNDIPAPEKFDPKTCLPAGRDKNWVEIWNDVFMQYVKDENGNYNPVKQKNVDTGMGLERTLAVLNGKENVFETDLFSPIIQKMEEVSKWKYNEDNTGVMKQRMRIIADHVRASVFMIADGIEPSNTQRGYILRRLIRRAVRKGRSLGMINNNSILEVARVVQEIYKDAYPEVLNENVLIELQKEENKFRGTVTKGLGELLGLVGIEEFFKNLDPSKKIEDTKVDIGKINGRELFNLYQTYGLPVELSIEEINWQMRFQKPPEKVDEEVEKKWLSDFQKELERHQELSRTASAGMFKGGLADHSEITTKYHTATHLLLAGLRRVLGEHVFQKGSNITAERLRFDFSHKEKMTGGQIKDVENFINGIIKEDLPVSFEEMTLEKAKELNAMGVFESKYGEQVKVYTIGAGKNVVSREICGGPHVERTGILGNFKIQKEESSSSGVRRIKAILE